MAPFSICYPQCVFVCVVYRRDSCWAQMCNSPEYGAIHRHTNTLRPTDTWGVVVRRHLTTSCMFLPLWSSNHLGSPFTLSQQLLASNTQQTKKWTWRDWVPSKGYVSILQAHLTWRWFSCSPGVYRNLPNTVWRVSLVPGKTRSEQIFCCSSALVSTDLVGADQLKPFYVALKPCVTLNSLWWGEECRGGWWLRVEGRWMSWLFSLITYIFCTSFSGFQFPYAAPPPQEPVKTLRSLINIRKDTLRLVR